GQGISLALGGHGDNRPHPLTSLNVPTPLRLDTSCLPEFLLLGMGSRFVPPGYEGGPLGSDQLQGLGGGLGLGNAGRIVLRTDDNEVVVHDVPAVHAEAV